MNWWQKICSWFGHPVPQDPISIGLSQQVSTASEYDTIPVYANDYVRAIVSDQWKDQAYFAAVHIQNKKEIYQQVSDAFPGLNIPFWLIGLIHCMESDFDWNTHLFNGDPLSARTVHYPAGQPIAGDPPFSWIESAIAALKFDEFDSGRFHFRSTPECLNALEHFNGWGYQIKGVKSPYLWSGTDLYKSGKFVEVSTPTGGYAAVYDPKRVSAQVGCVPIMKALGL